MVGNLATILVIHLLVVCMCYYKREGNSKTPNIENQYLDIENQYLDIENQYKKH